ncbi:MAG TPA: YsnF/AvaK domain-containing protein [Allosphingosinicella sp.]|nr:YsnF/AvaK domain-containing protein [Allosphingosinicella sp.]
MSRTVTALYDSRAEAEAARERLSSAVRADGIRIIDQGGGGADGLGGLHVSNDDRQAYGEGLRRGGALLCADVDGHEDADRIIALLEESASVDLDRRQESWRGEGWTPAGAASTGTATGTATGNVVQEERIPIVEEELRVGKREVERGGARVRSYIKETPVTEQVTLREEHVEVERRPVAQPATATAASATPAGSAEGLLQERTIEMRETAEEAVVQKVANVREELVVRKTAEEHVETVQDTVRRTEVDVSEGGERSAFGSFGSDDANPRGETGTKR